MNQKKDTDKNEVDNNQEKDQNTSSVNNHDNQSDEVTSIDEKDSFNNEEDLNNDGSDTQDEIKDLKDQLLRTLAENENLRREQPKRLNR